MRTTLALVFFCIVVTGFSWCPHACAQPDSVVILNSSQTERARPFVRDSAEFMSQFEAGAKGEDETRSYIESDGNEWMRTARNDEYYAREVKQRQFDRQAWEDERSDKNYRNEAPAPEERPLPSRDVNVRVPMGGTGLQTIMFVIVIGALAFILFRLFGGTFVRNRKVGDNKVYTIEDIEDRIHESDLDKFLREAIEKKDYRLAVRIYYLAIIKELSLRDWIRWKRDKTNREYLNEVISNKPELHGDFRDATLTFEKVWYGDIDLREQDYNTVSPRFKKIIDSISSRR